MSVSRRRLLIGASALVALALVGAIVAWRVALRGDAPAAVSLEGAVASLSATPSAASAEPSATAPAAGTGTAVARDGAPATLVGTWTLVPASSFVGYRVQEQLASIGANTAVGRTSAITGTLTYDGAAVTAVDVQADLTALRSDDTRRDNALRRQALETARFPTATFALTSPIALPDPPAEGETIDVTANGRLTLHGVTRDVAVPLRATLSGGQVVVVGSLPIAFADYDVPPPKAFAVLSVDDHGLMELQLVFARGA